MRCKYEHLVRLAKYLKLTVPEGSPHGLLAEDILRELRKDEPPPKFGYGWA
jgi:hypothetical protein